MINSVKYIYFFTFFALFSLAQNQTNNWYFGNQAGLSFNSNPPTILTNGQIINSGCNASMSNANGNLLFYTNGQTVWDQTHSVMANGTGLLGNVGASQNVIILKQPGNLNLFYIIHSQPNNVNGLRFSIVDMSLAAGNGSVTLKNQQISLMSSTKLTATKHCNGVDIWIVSQDYNWVNNNFNNSYVYRSYLLTSAGINTLTPAVSTFTNNLNNWNNWNGSMKISPNGKKLGVASQNGNNINNGSDNFQLYDFDNTTGLLSNYFSLWNGPLQNNNNYWAWGCEFSPDGTKFYGTRYNVGGGLYQWNLCAGSNTAIAASQATIAIPGVQLFSLQLAKNGKIYVARYGQQTLGVINNPNNLSGACNYVDLGQSITPQICYYGLPNFLSTYFISPPPIGPFTYTANNNLGCQTASFTPPITPNASLVGCASSGYSLTNLQWIFGDPASGAANTSTLTYPSHAFTNLGTYTTQLILFYSCGGGTDTLKQVVNINQPCISVSSTSITCANLGSATVSATGGIGPFSYTWMPSGQTNSVATGLSPGTYTLTVFDFGNNFTYTATTTFNSLIPLTGNLNNTPSLTCNGVNTATANFTNISGGSGSQNYVWTNGPSTQTTSYASNLSAGLWSVSVVDALTGCFINQIFFITQPPALSLNVSANTNTSCVGTNIILSANCSGGTPGLLTPYTYSWTSGPISNGYTVTSLIGGNFTYSIQSVDSLQCVTLNTITVSFISNPVLSISDFSICPFETGTLTVSGANSYTWNNVPGINTFTDNPIVSTQYSVIGTALSCTSIATASIILKPIPIPTVTSNSPLCNNQTLYLYGLGGVSFQWTGPLNFNSLIQNAQLSPAAPNNSGVYNYTVTAANSCTASGNSTVVVNPTPTISAFGSSVCVSQNINLSSNSFVGATYFWSGPNGFMSYLQNPIINAPLQVSASGNYTVFATSAVGCVNTTIANVSVTAMPVPSFISTSPKCVGTVLNFDASATIGAINYSWSGPNGFNSIQISPIISNVILPTAGIYTLTVSKGPCTNSISHSVVINALPTPTATSNSPVCETKNSILQVNGNNVSYIWNGPNGFNSPVQNPVINNSAIINSGQYQVLVTDINGCQASSSVSLTVMPNPVLITQGALVCFGEPATLKVIGANTYNWFGPMGFGANGSIATVTSAINTQAWTYYVIGTALNTCTSISTATVNTKTLPIASLSVTPRVCFNEQILFKGAGANYYYWSGPLNYTSAIQNHSLVANNQGMSGTYTLMVKDSANCKGYATANIIIDPLPTGGIDQSPISHCVPFCSDFKFYPSGENVIVNSIWTMGTKTQTSSVFNYCFYTDGDFTLKGVFTDNRGCINKLSFLIKAYPVPVADFSYYPENPLENRDEVYFTNNSKGDFQNDWSWLIFNDKDQASNEFNYSHLFKDAGTFNVLLITKNTFECSDSIIKTIKVDSDFSIFVPNTFTPNQDNKNETFIAVTRGVKFYNLTIFDRWGHIVFESEDTSIGWDGTFKGNSCINGVYVWKIKASSFNGSTKELNGHILLNK